ncbi:hypothetical protein F5Y17DRAFT_478134 [Xylariaceae sp. FL0594]|nr:hypothetical protein F5Y17DRAFT_478134 [Xylariaceae sp. FL0594]
MLNSGSLQASDTKMEHLTHILPSSSSQTSSPAVSTPDSSASMTKSSTNMESTKGGKRKGTRSVSTLTPAQLARKRANDREAQRAIRARTKEHIENLEREIDELRSQKSRDQTVQELLGRNRALEDEVRRLRESLGIRTAAGPGMPPYPTSYSGSSSQPSSYGTNTPEYPMLSDMPPYSSVPDNTNVWSSSVPCSIPSTVSSPSSPGAPDDFGGNYFPTSTPGNVLERSSMPPALNSPVASCMGGDVGFGDAKSVNSRVWMPPADRHRAYFPDIPPATVERVPRVLSGLPGPNLGRQLGPSYWEFPVLTSTPTCQEDALIAGFIASRQRSLNMPGRIPPHRNMILGSDRPNVRPLLEAHTHLLASLGLHGPYTQTPSGQPFVDIMRSIFDSNNIVYPLERVGNLHLSRALIGWLVQPSRETYIGLRDIFPPQSNQQTMLHPQWMDFMLWPQLRNAIIARQDLYNTAEFRHVYGTNIRLRNWPVTITEAFTVDFPTGAIYATDEFVEHVWDLRNWYLHENFTRRYPELGSCLGQQGWPI